MSSLLVKTILGFLALILVMSLAIFLPAGSLNFWQAWVFLSVWTVSVVLITAYLIRYDPGLLSSRVKAGPIAEAQRSQKIIQSLASLCFIGLLMIPGFDFRFHWSHVAPSLSLISDGLVVIGFFIVFLVFRENSFTSAIIEVSSEQKVISTGPYGLVRHPMYAGAGLLVIFASPALGSWFGIPCALALILVVALRSLEEEKFLLANLSGYPDYRRKVHYRLIPGIW